jgi:N-acetylmuramoyl-L-alanine amidase
MRRVRNRSHNATGRAMAALLLCLAIGPATAAQNQTPSPTPSNSPAPTQSPTANASPQASPQEQPSPKKIAPEFLVIIDPSHGGDDNGVTFSPRLLEKDITLAFARELRKELDDRGIAVRLLRENDISLPMEKRAEITNSHHNVVYIGIHAGRPGQGVRVYSASLPDATAPSRNNTGPFVPWSVAQSGALPRSRVLMKAVVNELLRKKLQAVGLDAPLRPLNNILAPAIAIELALANADVRSTESLKMQAVVASSVASAVANSKGQMGVRP